MKLLKESGTIEIYVFHCNDFKRYHKCISVKGKYRQPASLRATPLYTYEYIQAFDFAELLNYFYIPKDKCQWNSNYIFPKPYEIKNMEMKEWKKFKSLNPYEGVR